jgi:hypothetical protein
MLIAPALLMSLHAVVAQVEPTCTRWKECQQLALEAAERKEFETFHELAWRAVQTGQPNDPDLMFMLSRAQSLSGRPDDALVMLRRLAERGIPHLEAETLNDFSRMRDMAGWPNLLEKMREVASANARATPAPPPIERAAPPAPSPPKAPSRVVPPSRPARSKRPVEPAAPPVSRAATEADDTTRAAATIASVIPLPPAVSAPVALAYDKVSSRLILADESSGTLKVVSEVTGNEVSLVSRGWGGGYHSNALVIDSKRGDLWVVGTRTGERRESVLHRLQLISGRMLYSVPLGEDAGDSRFAALALGSSSVFVLDAEAGRIFELRAGAKTLRLRTSVQQRDLTGLTLAGDTVAYVAHGGGILRIDLATKRSESVTASPGVALDGIEWIGYFEGSLLALQRRADGALAAVRFRLDKRGYRLTAVDTLGAAASGAAAVFGNTFFFVAASSEGTAVARVNLRARSQASRAAKPGKRRQ